MNNSLKSINIKFKKKMKEKLFKNYGVTLALLIAVCVADFIGLTQEPHIGAGFIILFVYMVVGGLWTSRQPKNKINTKDLR